MNPTPQTLTSPVLEDAALLLIQAKLESELTWLTTAYGRAQKLVERDGTQREISFPAIYASSNDGREYIRMFPDELLGNYSFFDLRDEQEISNYATKAPGKNIYRFGADLIVWFDFRKVFPSPANWKAYSVANVVQQVSDVLQSSQLNGASVEIERYYYLVENVYRGYSHKEISNQFAMPPYGCFKIQTKITYKKQC